MLQFGTNAAASMWTQLNQLGSVGFEVAGISAVDRTLGLNAVIVILKRSRPTPLPPSDTAAGWKSDRLQRFAYRWWNGENWEKGVTEGGSSEIGKDWPIA